MNPSALPYQADEALPLRVRIGRGLRFQVLPGAFAVAFGMALTLCMCGYQFGRSNHTVYLLDALRRVHPELLRNDWFTTGTFQYHAIFGWLSATLMRHGLIEPAFLMGYLLLLFLMQLACYRLVLSIGGTRMTYLLSILLFTLLAGGTGLGMYNFFQDSAFLPSNVSNVAMLWGIYFWVRRKYGWAGAWLGLAGAMHLNYAVVGVAMWGMLSAGLLIDGWRKRSVPAGIISRPFLVGTLLCLGLSLANVGVALWSRAAVGEPMPLREFVALYVRLRHAHHYDPSTWPVALWLCLLVPMPFAWIAWRKQKSHAATQLGRVFLFFAILLIVALLLAGFYFVNESLIQLSLYRFSIYPKLFASIGCAWFLYNSGSVTRSHLRKAMLLLPVTILVAGGVIIALGGLSGIAPVAQFIRDRRGLIGLMLLLTSSLAIYELIYAQKPGPSQDLLHAGGVAVLVAIVAIAWGRWLGVNQVADDPPAYLRFCAWVKNHTKVDALFVVPPQEQSFRLHAERAIVVNFKGVAQLSGELRAWRDRLGDVLGMSDLTLLQRPFNRTLPDLADRYRARTPAQLAQVAGRYGATYVVTDRIFPHTAETPSYPFDLVHESDGYFLYALRPTER